MSRRLILIPLGCLVFLFSFSQAIAQSQTFYDSLKQADALTNEGNYQAALDILDQLENDHPGNEYVIRLKGKTLYWSNDFDATSAYFEKALDNYPELWPVRLDYGRIAFELGNWKTSETTLKPYLDAFPDDPEANIMMAQLNYWKGGKSDISYQYLNRVLDPYPDNEQALAIREEIKLATSPKLTLNPGFYDDSQPMRYSSLNANLGFYKSAALQPGISAGISSYASGQTVGSFLLRNTASFPATGTAILFRGGIASSSGHSSPFAIYGAELRQKMAGNLELNLSADKEAYFYTLASLDQTISPFTYKASIGRESGGRLLGKIFYQRSEFDNSNWVQSMGLWALLTAINTPRFGFDLGYSLNLSDSKEVLFSENLPITQTIQNTEIGTVIPGSYSPYFTPIDQTVHGVLGKIRLAFSDRVDLSITGNIGVSAEIQNPNMIYYGSTGNSQANRPISPDDVYLVLIPTTYSPLDLKTTLSWKSSKKTSISITHQYLSTIFFDSNSLSLTFANIFLK